MAETCTGAESAQTTHQEEIRKLRDTVDLIDCLCKGGCREIAVLARLSLTRLETPEGWDDYAPIDALAAIMDKAESLENDITGLADYVGCAHVDEAALRRWAARATHLKGV